jgi:hypothetical protein
MVHSNGGGEVKTLIEVTPMDRMIIEVEIPEHEIGYVHAGSEPRIKIDAIGRNSTHPSSRTQDLGFQDPASEDPASEPHKVRIAKALSLLIRQRIPLFPGDPVAAYLSRKIGRIFSPQGTFWSLLSIASGLLIVTANATEISSKIRQMFDASIWIALIVMWVVAKAIHEFRHATAARCHGVRVGNMGVMFFLFAR